MVGRNMNLSFGLNTIFQDAEFIIEKSDKVGIVGVNGAGKTTLFNILLKKQELDSGKIQIDKGRIDYLPQEIKFENGSMTVWEYLQEGRPIRKLEEELNQVYELLATESDQYEKLLKKMAELQEQLESYDYYRADDILKGIVERMGIKDDLLKTQLEYLSGGEKSKIAFARVLYANPEILLLDEPTNHIDASTRAFIVSYLKNFRGMVLIISHDVEFLNEIINKVLFINKVTHKISVYEGNYTAYKKRYAQEQRLQEMRILQQEKEIKELSDFVQKAKQARQIII